MYARNGTCQSDYVIRVGIYRKTASYVTLNKTNLWPDKVRDPSYCKGGWWKLENRKSPGGLPFRRSQFYLRSRSNRGTRYNSYGV